MLEPRFVLGVSRVVMEQSEGYARTLAAVRCARDAINQAVGRGETRVPPREKAWLARLSEAVDDLPETEEEAFERVGAEHAHLYRKDSYGLTG